MTYTDLQNCIRIALETPNTANRLVASLALEDFADAKDERIEKYETVLHKLATSPWAPQRVVDMAREALASDDEEERGHPDAWTGGFAENH